MAPGKGITEETRKRIMELHAAGKGRNEIVRELGVSCHTVTTTVRDRGGTFNRAATEAATAARIADCRKRLSVVAERLIDDAEALQDQLFAPVLVHSFGGRDNTYNEHELDEPTFRDKRDIMHSISTAATTAQRILDSDQAGGSAAHRSTLDEFFAAVQAISAAQKAAEGEA